MRDLLEAVAAGELSPAAAEAELTGYATDDAGRFDAARTTRRGIPEAILADGKTPEQVRSLTQTALETEGRALLTRLEPDAADSLVAFLEDDVSVGVDEGQDTSLTIERRGTALLVYTDAYDRPSLEATVAIVTAGTVDGPVADEAHLVCLDAGCTIDRIEDVGVASLVRVVDQLERLREADVVIVAAGREGALPTVVAGLVDAPVIGVPVSSGYGYGGDGEAALLGMLQSCTVLSVVNVDAGFVAGAQATLVAQAIDTARREKK